MSVSKNHSIRLFTGFFIIELLLTGLFLLCPKNPVVITSYCFALLAPVAPLLVMMEWANSTKKNYITNAALPSYAFTYLGCNWAIGLLFSILSLTVWEIHCGWLMLIHAVLLAFMAWRYLILDAGKEQIEELGQRVEAKVINWQMIRADVENLKSYTPADYQKNMQDVIDAIRYADPMSSDALFELDEAIKDNVMMLEVKLNAQQYDELAMLCIRIQRQIKDRNTRMKLLK